MVNAEYRVIVKDTSSTSDLSGEAEDLLRTTAQVLQRVLTDSIPPFMEYAGLSFHVELVRGTVELADGSIHAVEG